MNDGENCDNVVTGYHSLTKNWICSQSYASPIYALHVCPFKKSTCGPHSKFELYGKGEDGAIHIKDLKPGDTCTYNVGAVCGAPSFSAQNATGVEVLYMEWQKDRVETTIPYSEHPPYSTEITEGSPLHGMPVRSNFELPVGVYNKSIQDGWKSWGNQWQGTASDNVIGRRQRDSDLECTPRNMLISVVGRYDDSQMLLEFRTSEFSGVFLSLGAALGSAVLSYL